VNLLSDGLVEGKLLALLRTFFNYGHRKFYNVGPGLNTIKLFSPITNGSGE
jgi:hypothetical protein